MVDKVIRIGIDSGPAEAGAKRVRDSLNGIKQAAAQVGKGVPVKIDTSDVSKASSEVRKLSDTLKAAASGSRRIDLTANASGLTSEIKKAEAAIASLKRQTESLSKNSTLRLNSAGFISEAERVVASLKKISAEADDTKSSTVALGATLGKAFAGAAAAVGATELVRSMAVSVYKANAEFQKLMASLETVTGSSAGAKAAFAEIDKFAKETPYGLTQVTEAFIKLKAMGLEPSMDALRAYGNTASAMGKPIMQMIEAVADAATGEFERLKEFGIKAKQEGDKVSLTFQGVTTTIGNNAKEIEKYLQNIGNVNFAGGMARQMNTLEGKFSQLQDTVDAFNRKIGDAGLNGALMKLAEELTRTVAGADSLAGAIGTLAGSLVEGLTQAIRNTRSELESLGSLMSKIKEQGSTSGSFLNQTLKSFYGIPSSVLDKKPGEAPAATAAAPVQPLPKEFTSKFGDIMALRESATKPFLLTEDGKAMTRSNVLQFSRPLEDEADSQAGKPRSGGGGGSRGGGGGGGGGGGRNIAEEFAKEYAAGDKLNRMLALMDQSYERGRGSVEGFRNSIEETNLRISAQQQYGEKNAEALVNQAMAAKAYQESIAFKGEVLNQQEAIQQTVSLADAYRDGTVAVMEAEAANKAWNTAVQLGVTYSAEQVEQLKNLALEADAANRYLTLETDLAAMDQEIESAARLATAYREGGAAIREAGIEEQVRAAAVAAGLEWDEASVQKIRDKMTALRDLQEVQASDEKAMMAGFDLEAVEGELRMSQMIGEARYIEAERLQMLIDKKRELKDATATLTAEEERQAEAMGRANYAIDTQSTALEDLAQSIPNIAYAFEEATRGALMSFEDALVGIVTGTKSAREAFADMARSIATDLARMAIRMAIIQPLAMLFGGMMGGGAGMVASNVAVGATSTAFNLSGGGQQWHSGGIVGSDSAPFRSFASLPKFHNGGLAANEMPAVLQKGEGVFTKAQMQNLQPVNNNSQGLTVVNNISVQAPPGGDRMAAENQANSIAKAIEMAVDERLMKATRNGGILSPNGGAY